MNLFFLLLLDPPSFLHPQGPGCAVPRAHAPYASCPAAILDWGPRFVSEGPAEEAERGESAASRRAICKTQKLFLQRTVIGLGLIGTNAEG
jgi:hypothetical protein